MKRFRLSKRANKINFRRTAQKVHPKNLIRRFGRGGISL